MICECGGILLVESIEPYPEHLTKEERLTYDRVCDVKCEKCHKIYFSQPYDGTRLLNRARNIKKKGD